MPMPDHFEIITPQDCCCLCDHVEHEFVNSNPYDHEVKCLKHDFMISTPSDYTDPTQVRCRDFKSLEEN